MTAISMDKVGYLALLCIVASSGQNLSFQNSSRRLQKLSTEGACARLAVPPSSPKLQSVAAPIVTGPCPAVPVAPPKTSEDFATMLRQWAECNQTLYDYFLGNHVSTDLHRHYFHQWGCQVSSNCWCDHVVGDPDKDTNPDGWMHADHRSAGVGLNPGIKDKRCSCWTGRGKPCLSGHMSAVKLLYGVGLARAIGATRIIEEGREGGMSTFAYHIQGLKVDSVEYAPLTQVKDALWKLAPEIRQLDGDGRVIVPDIIRNLSAEDAARTIVMFDGEKRHVAYQTYKLIRDQVGAAIFDDVNQEAGFLRQLREWEGVVFSTLKDKPFKELKGRGARQVPCYNELAAPSIAAKQNADITEAEKRTTEKWAKDWVHGMMVGPAEYAIIVGGGWKKFGFR